MAALGVGTSAGKKGLQDIIDRAVAQAVDKELDVKLAPRLAAIENRLSAIETMLDMAQRLSKIEAEISALRAAKA